MVLKGRNNQIYTIYFRYLYIIDIEKLIQGFSC